MLDSYRRLPQWRTRLAAALVPAARKPFVWGEHDCCLGLAFPAINAVIGLDLSGPYVGQYSTPIGALLALKRQGHDGILKLFEAHFEQVHPSRARHGDIVAKADEGGNWGMGVCLGARAAVLQETGYGTLELALCERAYRIG